MQLLWGDCYTSASNLCLFLASNIVFCHLQVTNVDSVKCTKTPHPMLLLFSSTSLRTNFQLSNDYKYVWHNRSSAVTINTCVCHLHISHSQLVFTNVADSSMWYGDVLLIEKDHNCLFEFLIHLNVADCISCDSLLVNWSFANGNKRSCTDTPHLTPCGIRNRIVTFTLLTVFHPVLCIVNV